jgi:hypothetical protein
MNGVLMLLGLIAMITVVPIKLAADFTDGKNTGLLFCAMAAVVAPGLSIFAFRLSSGGLPGVVLAFFAGITAYVVILRIPGRSIVGFSIITVALQLAVFGGMLSFGVNLGRMFLS